MIKTTKEKGMPKTTIESGKKFLVDMDRDPEIGFNPKTTAKMKTTKKKGGK